MIFFTYMIATNIVVLLFFCYLTMRLNVFLKANHNRHDDEDLVYSLNETINVPKNHHNPICQVPKLKITSQHSQSEPSIYMNFFFYNSNIELENIY